MAAAEAEVQRLSVDEEGQPLGEITPEMQAEVDRLNEELIASRRRLRDVQYELTEDIERLGEQPEVC